jgi:hypothetical protein
VTPDESPPAPEGPSEVIDGFAAYTDMVSTLTGSRLLTPPVPTPLAGSLTAHNWAWTTTTELFCEAVYFNAFDVLDRCLDDSFGDFFLFGHRGHGANSYGMGMLARFGGIFVAQQHSYGGMYMEPGTETPINNANQAWAQLLDQLPGGQQPCTVAVVYSSYRGGQCIISNHSDDAELAIVKDTSNLPAGWKYLYAANAFNDHDQGLFHLDRLRTTGRPLTRVAADHLWRLVSDQEEATS